MTFIKPTTLLVGALCLTETAAEADVKFNTNLSSAFTTPALGHAHGLYTSVAVTKTSGSYVAPSECKTECETAMTTAISTSTTFGAQYLCEYTYTQNTGVAAYAPTCSLKSVLWTASSPPSGYPNMYDPRVAQDETDSNSLLTKFHSWYYMIDTAKNGAITAVNPVSQYQVPASACPTQKEIADKVKSDLYAELFEGFAAAKAADASLTPRTQLAADNVTPMGTLEKRFAAKVEGSKTIAVNAGNDVNTAGSKILKSPTLWTSLEAGFQEATTTCPDAAAVKAAVTEGAPAAAPDADAAELRFAATLLASVAVLAPFA